MSKPVEKGRKSNDSHLLLLSEVIQRCDIRTVLEFGPGHGSTKLFMDLGLSFVDSVDQESEEWAEMLQHEEWYDRKRGRMRYCDNATDDWSKLEYEDKYYMVFVDGCWRWQIINAMASRTNIIVAHDTQAECYEWYNVALPSNWKRYDNKVGHNGSEVWTTLWSPWECFDWVTELRGVRK